MFLNEIIKNNTLPKQFPIEDILKGSCHYPASGYDMSPVYIMQKFGLQSFVYCDYAIKKEEYIKYLASDPLSSHKVIFQKNIEEYEFKVDKTKLTPIPEPLRGHFFGSYGKYQQFTHIPDYKYIEQKIIHTDLDRVIDVYKFKEI